MSKGAIVTDGCIACMQTFLHSCNALCLFCRESLHSHRRLAKKQSLAPVAISGEQSSMKQNCVGELSTLEQNCLLAILGLAPILLV